MKSEVTLQDLLKFRKHQKVLFASSTKSKKRFWVYLNGLCVVESTQASPPNTIYTGYDRQSAVHWYNNLH